MNKEKKEIPEKGLMDAVFKRLSTDTAFRAACKRADNPDTEYQSWEYLAEYKVNLEYEESRLPFATILSSAARSSRHADGSVNLGKALLIAYDGDIKNTAARAKLRRILVCDTVQDACRSIRPILRFIESKGIGICYSDLLHDLRYFSFAPERAKSKWAQQFFGKDEEPLSKEEGR